MLLLLQPMLLMLLLLLLLLRSLKCSIKLVQPAIAQAPPSLSLLRGNDNFVFMAFYGGSIDPAEKRLARETSELVLLEMPKAHGQNHCESPCHALNALCHLLPRPIS